MPGSTVIHNLNVIQNPVILLRHKSHNLSVMKNISLFFSLSIALFCCTKAEKKLPEIAQRDTTITKENSFTELFIDSTALLQFSQREGLSDSISNKMQSFYNQRNHQFAWFFPDGLADFAATFISLQNDYINFSGDSTIYDASLVTMIDSVKHIKKINPTESIIIDTELSLTRQFFNYASKAYSGDPRINTQELDWFIPRRKLNPQVFLDSLLKNKGKNLTAYEPVNRQYNLLKEKLLAYAKIQKEADTVKIEITKKLKEGASAEVIRHIKKRLFHLGDLPALDTTMIFDTTLTAAVMQFQERVGLVASGVIDASFLAQLNIPPSERMRTILINMERIRWMPAAPSTDYILVNIPEFRMHVYEKGELAFNMVVVVGSEAHNTVIFSGTLNQVVFSPYWNIPTSILKNEILPGIKRQPNYLAKHNMEWNGNSVRQKPGKTNSLGLVKFLFPNSYNIYFHDTPSKSLFNEPRRAFSHGCIRLAEPTKLAEFLLRNNSQWDREKITKAMHAGTEKYVRLKGDSEIPVFIGYFTSWVDRNGHLNFRNDVYGHDKKMADRLFGATKI
jgi:murein L,D-transpeptidase YcbB/YkuD